MEGHRLTAITGPIRSHMRSENYRRALQAIEEWWRFLPEPRIPRNVAVLEILDGGSPAGCDSLRPAATAIARREYYYRFLAGILCAHAGRSKEVTHYLRRFLPDSSRRACT